ncbi:MAG TPA: porphobilinogen synthase [Candidatus Eisenbacteria bacterium]|nr:porphobilinogen synthase [Candidatus Eisenbacteria bacterium]
MRGNAILREMLGEHRLSARDLVQPLFVKEGISRPAPIPSMPGQFQWPVNGIAGEAKRLRALGVPAVILFGIPVKKDPTGKAASAANGSVQRAVKILKKACPDLLVITDVCLCEYTSHGHCGHVDGGKVLNDASVKALAQAALSHAESGADVVAPSDMMDGRVAAIRGLLDKKGFEDLPLISYSVKYASGFYAPFRDAAESAPRFGDRATYQMDPANASEALREAQTDLEEGADMLLVKPALGYGDIVCRIREKFSCPVGCYSVSGEYAMIKAAAERGWLDEKRMVLETHLSMKRAGASFIVTYWAGDLARWLSGKASR